MGMDAQISEEEIAWCGLRQSGDWLVAPIVRSTLGGAAWSGSPPYVRMTGALDVQAIAVLCVNERRKEESLLFVRPAFARRVEAFLNQESGM